MKPYVKPELYYENFELAQHIAGCDLELKLADGLTCKATGTISDDVFGATYLDTWFLSEPTCEAEVQSYCYTNGSASHITINS